MRRTTTAAALAAAALVTVAAGGCQRRWEQQVIYVEDHTDPAWPIAAATTTWDAGLNASVRYGPCQPDAGCIEVFAEHLDDPDLAGETTWQAPGGQMQSATVRMNTTYTDLLTDQEQLAAACHEIGHGLGLDHNPSRDSCMYELVLTDPTASPTATAPADEDLAALNDTDGGEDQ